jgi:hypothetical protein
MFASSVDIPHHFLNILFSVASDQTLEFNMLC